MKKQDVLALKNAIEFKNKEKQKYQRKYNAILNDVDGGWHNTKKLVQIQNNQNRINDYLKVLHNNLNHVLCEIAIPQIVAIAQKYDNKKMGQATITKFCNEIADLEVFANNYYASFYRKSYDEHCTFCIGYKNQYRNYLINEHYFSNIYNGNISFINNENKLQAKAFEQITNKYEYIEDIDVYLNQLEAKKDKYNQLKKALEQTIFDYNENLIDGFEFLKK